MPDLPLHTEPPQLLRKHFSLKGLSYEQAQQVLTRGARAGCDHGDGLGIADHPIGTLRRVPEPSIFDLELNYGYVVLMWMTFRPLSPMLKIEILRVAQQAGRGATSMKKLTSKAAGLLADHRPPAGDGITPCIWPPAPSPSS